MRSFLSFLAEESGKISFARLLSTILIFCYIGWATYIVINKQIIPDMPLGLATLIILLYGFNKAAAILINRRSNNDN